jgi:hypothetical protein
MTPQLFDSLGVIADYVNWQQRLSGIEGFLYDLEGYILMQLAAKGAGSAPSSRSAAFWYDRLLSLPQGPGAAAPGTNLGLVLCRYANDRECHAHE